jgi:hypothetical protein
MLARDPKSLRLFGPVSQALCGGIDMAFLVEEKFIEIAEAELGATEHMRDHV